MSRSVPPGPAEPARASRPPAAQGNRAVAVREDERIRDEGAEPLLAVFRLLKTAQIHDANNDAVAITAGHAADALRRFYDLTGRGATYTFVRDMIFVCGQLLCAPRATYEAASELGMRCDAVE